jgi:hypothetical protein
MIAWLMAGAIILLALFILFIVLRMLASATKADLARMNALAERRRKL